MGVKGLWSLLDPTAKSVRLESLEGKVVAVDASIWLFQFVKAMRDSKGEVLHGAHLVGFLRRICKLLYHRIKPVFVFDGAAPELKSLTIQARQEKQSKAEYSLQKTAQLLLEARVKLNTLEALTNEPLTNAVASGANEPTRDEYELPEEQSRSQGKLDHRLATEDEIQDFISKHHHDIDFTKTNINSVEFQSLPISIQHQVILDLKNKSRAPSQARVQQMLDNSETALDFSNQQIKNVIHRATLTKRYHDSLRSQEGVLRKRVAGSRQTTYVLEKSTDERGGWKMNLQSTGGSNKVVESLDGLEGFRETKRVNVAERYDIESISFDEIADKVERKTDNFKLDSYLDEFELFHQEPADQLTTLNFKDPDFWASQWLLAAPDSFRKLYIDFESILSVNILTYTDSSLEGLLKVLQQRRSQTLDKDKIEAHEYYISFVEAAIKLKQNIPKTVETVVLLDESPPKESVSINVLDDLSDSSSIVFDISERPEAPEEHSEDPFQSVFNNASLKVSNDTTPAPLLEQEVIEIDSGVDDSQVKETTVLDEKEIIDVESSDYSQEEWDLVVPISPKRPEKPIVVDLESPEPAEKVAPVNDEIVYINDNETAKNEGIVQDKDKFEIEDFEYENIDVGEIVGEEAESFYRDLDPKTLDEALTDARERYLQISTAHIRDMRDVSGVTTQMVTEVQDLLMHFGIPYIVAPMEAESQCAFLQMNNLVDGIITDDSDVFLFGGEVVYKNVFDPKKFVERYRLSDFEELGLNRAKLIQMAYILGSDYTLGIKGLGPVASIEIVNHWEDSTLEGLEFFKKWVKDLHDGIITKEDSLSLKALISACKKIKIPDSFPDPRIFEAYMEPTVDESKQRFSWAAPNLVNLRFYLSAKLFWPKEKIDAVLAPVIKQLNSPQRQTRIEEFFPILPKAVKSKRVLNATRGGRKKKKT